MQNRIKQILKSVETKSSEKIQEGLTFAKLNSQADWQAYFVAAQEYLNGRFSSALQQIEKAVQLNSEEIYFTYAKGVILLENDYSEAALEIFRRLYAAYPNQKAILLHLSISYLAKNLHKEAMDVIEEAIVKFPRDSEFYRLKGIVYSYANEDQKALAAYDFSLTIDAQNYDALRGKGASLYNLGYIESAYGCFKEALALQPADFDSITYCGLALFKMQRYQEAISVFNSALDINPDAASVSGYKAITLCFMRRYKEAQAALEQVRNIPECEVFTLASALLSALKNDFSTALEILDKKTTSSTIFTVFKAYFEHKNGNSKQALELLQNKIRNEKADYHLFTYLAIIHKETGDIDNFIKQIRFAVNLKPYGPKPHYLAGEVYENLGFLHKAKDSFWRAVNVAPYSENGWLGLIRVDETLHNWENCLVNLEEALRLMPQSQALSASYAAILRKIGKTEQVAKVQDDFYRYCLLKAELYYLLTDYKLAKVYYEKATSFKEVDAFAYIGLAKTACALGENFKQLADKAFSLDASTPWVAYLYGIQYLNEQDYAEAYAFFKEAEENGLHTVKCISLQIFSLMQQGEMGKAKEELEKNIAYFGKSPEFDYLASLLEGSAEYIKRFAF